MVFSGIKHTTLYLWVLCSTTELTSDTKILTEITINKRSCRPLCWTTFLLSQDPKTIILLSCYHQKTEQNYLNWWPFRAPVDLVCRGPWCFIECWMNHVFPSWPLANYIYCVLQWFVLYWSCFALGSFSYCAELLSWCIDNTVKYIYIKSK